MEWLGELPERWALRRAKTLFTKESRSVENGAETVTCFRDGQVTLRKNRRTTGFTEAIQEFGYQGVCNGDLVIHVMDAFAGAIGVSDSDGKCTPVYSVCTARDDCTNNYYYAYLLREMARAGWIQALYRGIRERSSDFRYDVFAMQLLPLPPREEQDQIVRYLDWKVSQINKLINVKKKQITLLQEQKQVLISSKLSETASYRKCKLKNLAHFKSGTNLTSMQITDDGQYPVFGGNGLRGYYPEFSHDGEYLLVGRQGALCGNVHYVCSRFWATDHAITVKPVETVDAKWLYYMLLNMNLNQYSMAAAQPGLSVEVIINLPAYFPSLNDQQEIVAFLDEKCDKIGQIATAMQTQITLLHEYRTRLISDVVTGKMDVRDVKIPDYEAVEEVADTADIEIDETEGEQDAD